MAGAGSRFALAGYLVPKPLITVHNVEMIRIVIDNIRPTQAHRFIFVCQRAHIVAFGLAEKLATWAPGCLVVSIDKQTRGAAETVLAAAEFIDSDEPLMIANSDQYVVADIDEYLAAANASGVDGLIMTMQATDPKWSYIGRSGGLVDRVVEKEVVSDEGTVGIYNFASGADFVSAARSMIEREEFSQGEFYVAPTYNALIAAGRRIETFTVGNEASGMYGLGIPSDLDLFAATNVSRWAVQAINAHS